MYWNSLRAPDNSSKGDPVVPHPPKKPCTDIFTEYSWNRNNLCGKWSSLEVISSSGLFMSKMPGPYFLISPADTLVPGYRWLTILQKEEGKLFRLKSLWNQYFSAVQGFLSLLSLPESFSQKMFPREFPCLGNIQIYSGVLWYKAAALQFPCSPSEAQSCGQPWAALEGSRDPGGCRGLQGATSRRAIAGELQGREAWKDFQGCSLISGLCWGREMNLHINTSDLPSQPSCHCTSGWAVLSF